MTIPNSDETLPTNSTSESEEISPLGAESFSTPLLPDQKQPAKTRRRRTWPLITMIGLLALLLIAAASAYNGYQSGIEMRTSAESTLVAQQVEDQFNLAKQDLEAKNYDRARQRFQWVVEHDPDHPEVMELLSQVLMQQNATATPTVVPTPTITPTPDTRGVEEKFAQAQQYLANNDWTNTIDSLLNLRKADPNYHAVDIDGMLYLAFRNRGREKITQADLEGGIYDLTLAERFGPLDSEAQGFLTWTRLYITGASFWEINWVEAVNYFSQIAPAYPSLMDSSGMTAKERYRLALIGYAETLLRDDKPCQAQEQYQLSLDLGPDPIAEEGLQRAAKNCGGDSDEDDDDDEEQVEEEQTPPPVEETPVVQDTPAVQDTPVVQDTPIVEETPPAEAAPTATQEPPPAEPTAPAAATP